MNAIEARDAMCRQCKHYQRTALFELCKHPSSQYWIEGRGDFHTIGHMRTIGACGNDAVLLDRTVKGKK